MFRSVCRVLFAGAALATMAAPGLAAPTRCEDSAGRVTYVDAACPAGTRAVRAVSTAPAVAEPDQKNAQQRAAAESKEARRLQGDREKKERADAAEQRKAQQAAATRSKHCAKLKLHAQRTAETAAKAPPAKADAARRKAQRAADDYALACPTR